MKGDTFKVNFLIVGAQKSGTSALAHFLSQHPEICVSEHKETHFFDSDKYDDARTFDEINRDYRAYFTNYSGQRIIGEATPIYMYLPHIMGRIYKYNPYMKLIFLLRNPVERAVSHYNMEVERKREWLPLILAIMAERFRLWRHRNNFKFRVSSLRLHSYVDRGFYSRQIINAQKYFPSDQMLFLKMEDLLNNHEETIRRVYDFLGVKDKTFIASPEMVFSQGLKVKVSEGSIRELARIYQPEIERLEDLIGMDLSDWKAEKGRP